MSNSTFEIKLGYCPCCQRNTHSLPKPAEGTCAECCNHQMIECLCTKEDKNKGGCGSCNPFFEDK